MFSLGATMKALTVTGVLAASLFTVSAAGEAPANAGALTCGKHSQRDEHGNSWTVWTNCKDYNEFVAWFNADAGDKTKCVTKGQTVLLDPTRVTSDVRVEGRC
ncbi:hypothetical protein D5S17_25900 [Pseudonocardiaceae bacterium YIM PH 21723]|nr:hypothetical protein D5S17_25900 [Pseudonocardiaceae bacterium YIM PH 21723]